MQPFEGAVVLRVHNGRDVKPHTYDRKGPSIPINVPFHDGPGDFYAVSASGTGIPRLRVLLQCQSQDIGAAEIVVATEQTDCPVCALE